MLELGTAMLKWTGLIMHNKHTVGVLSLFWMHEARVKRFLRIPTTRQTGDREGKKSDNNPTRALLCTPYSINLWLEWRNLLNSSQGRNTIMKQPATTDQQIAQSEAPVTIIPAAPSPASQPVDQPEALVATKSSLGSGVCDGEVQKIPVTERPVVYVAAYCRVSTDLEEQEGSLESQVAHWTEYVTTHGPAWSLVGV